MTDDQLRYAQRAAANGNIERSLDRIELILQRLRTEWKRGNPGAGTEATAELGQWVHTLVISFSTLFWLDVIEKVKSDGRT